MPWRLQTSIRNIRGPLGGLSRKYSTLFNTLNYTTLAMPGALLTTLTSHTTARPRGHELQLRTSTSDMQQKLVLCNLIPPYSYD